jgi:dTMP kinase
MFFSFDGLDGVGKSTQIDLFCRWLRAAERQVVACRDPGSTELGESIRELLLAHRDGGMSMTAEMLLYMAARAQLVDELIRPALARGQIVVCDRYLLANVVYQGYAGGLPPGLIREIGRTATGGIEPDVVFVLDMPHQAAHERLGGKLDRLESRGEAFRARLREGYLAEARRSPDKIVVIDAARTIEEVHRDICRVAEPLLNRT